MPALGDNALLKLGPALGRFNEQPPLEPTPAGIAFLEAVLGEDLDGAEGVELEAAVERLRALSPQLTAFIAEPMLRVTMVPTKAHGSRKENVIPSLAEVLVDCRVPPGGGEAEARRRLEALLGPIAGNYELEFTERVTGNSSPHELPARRRDRRVARPSSTPRRPWSRS